MDDTIHDGWKFPDLSRKAHYYKEGGAISLCRKWLYTGPFCKSQGTLGESPGPDDCRVCHRKAVSAKIAAAVHAAAVMPREGEK